MTAYPGKGGETLELAVESALGTQGSYSGLHIEEGFEFPTDSISLAQPSHMGKQHWANTDDSPVTYETYKEDAIKCPMLVRAKAAQTPPIVTMLESGGLNLTTTTSVDLDAWTSGVSFSVDASGSFDSGTGGAIESDDGKHWPFIVASNSGTSSFNIVPGYQIPATVSTPASNDCFGAYTLTPRAQQVPTNKTVSLRHHTRQPYSSGTMRFCAEGCAISGTPKITFEPGKPIKFDFSLHHSQLTLQNATYASGYGGVSVTDPFLIWGGSSSQFAFADADTDGGISAGTVNLIKAEVDFAHKVVPIIGTGTTGSLNNCQGYMSVPGHATITLTVLCDVDYWTDLINGINQMRYIHFAQAGTSSSPFFGAFFPRCQQIGMPQLVDKRGDYMQCVLTYQASLSEWGGDDEVDTDASSPWYIVTGIGVAAE